MAITEKQTFGVLLVATHNPAFLQQAYLTAISIKIRDKDLAIVLITDDAEHEIAKRKCFDDVISIKPNQSFEQPWLNIQVDRIRALEKSPFEKTVYIQAGSVCLSSDLLEIEKKLDTQDLILVESSIETSVSAKLYGKPLFQTGFIAYNKSKAVLKLFSGWAGQAEAYFQLAGEHKVAEIKALEHIEEVDKKQRLAMTTQLSLAQFISPKNLDNALKCETLADDWFYVGQFTREKAPEIKIYGLKVPEQHLKQLQDLYGEKKFKEAVNLNQQLIQAFPWNTHLRFLLAGFCAYVQKDFTKVPQIMGKSLALDPYHKGARKLLVQCQEQNSASGAEDTVVENAALEKGKAG